MQKSKTIVVSMTAYILSIILGLIGVIYIAQADMTCLSGSTSCTRQIGMSLTLYSSYSGILSYHSASSQYISGSTIYVGTSAISVNIGTNATSTYIMSGGDLASIYTGQGSGNYAPTVRPTTVTSGDGPKVISIQYDKSGEYSIPPSISVYLDTTPPSMPIYTSGVVNGVINTGSYPIAWTGGDVDTGAGWSGFVIHFALDASFVTDTHISTTGYSFTATTTNLPLGTIFRYIESVDHLGNSIRGPIQYFHNGTPSTPPGGGGGGGGGGLPLPCRCGGDYPYCNTCSTGSTGQIAIPLNTYDPYICGGDIWGVVSDTRDTSTSVVVKIYRGADLVRTYTPSIGSDGIYEIQNPHQDLAAGAYIIKYELRHNNGLISVGSYLAYITNVCNEDITTGSSSNKTGNSGNNKKLTHNAADDKLETLQIKNKLIAKYENNQSKLGGLKVPKKIPSGGVEEELLDDSDISGINKEFDKEVASQNQKLFCKNDIHNNIYIYIIIGLVLSNLATLYISRRKTSKTS